MRYATPDIKIVRIGAILPVAISFHGYSEDYDEFDIENPSKENENKW